MNLKKFYDKYFAFIFIFIFLVLSILLITHHELWRDEVHAWNIANTSESLSQFVYYMRQSEGTPYLWNFILFLASHFITKNIEIIKVIHLIVATASAFLILKFAPFNKIIKVLLIFGYFFFYEYAIISRNYALGILFILVFCILYKNKHKNILPISITLFFMGACNMYSFFISVFFILLLLIDFINERKNIFQKINKVSLSFSAIIVIAEMIMIYWQIGGQFTSNFATNPNFKVLLQSKLVNIKSLPSIIVNAFLPIPNNNINFWNSNFIVNSLSGLSLSLLILLSVILIIISVYLLNKKLRIIFIFCFIVIISFMLFFYFGSIRHWGHVFVLFIACLWLSKEGEKMTNFYMYKPRKIIFNIFIIFILSCSVLGSIISFYYDYKFPFSNAKNVAEYVKENYDLDDLVIVGHKNYTTEPVAGFLNKDFYYPQEKKFSRVFNMYSTGTISANEILSAGIELKIKNPNKNIIVLNDISNEIIKEDAANLDFDLKKVFLNAIVQDENYQLFLLNDNFSAKLVQRVDIENISANFININNCEINSKNNKLYIKALSDDPFFELNFKFPSLNEKDRYFIRIGIETFSGCDLELYYKRMNSNFNPDDLSTRKIFEGYNDVVIELKNINSLESLRVDPVNVRTECIIDKIEIYKSIN